ncbi:hypothetical protein NUSPORA_01883 [Nucleospora cyclopteri]
MIKNQFGAVRGVQGAKGQVVLSLAINKRVVTPSKPPGWIDVNKVFECVNYGYLISCIKKVNLLKWILAFLKIITSRWNIVIQLDKDSIINLSLRKASFKKMTFFLCCLYYV